MGPLLEGGHTDGHVSVRGGSRARARAPEAAELDPALQRLLRG